MGLEVWYFPPAWDLNQYPLSYDLRLHQLDHQGTHTQTQTQTHTHTYTRTPHTHTYTRTPDTHTRLTHTQLFRTRYFVSINKPSLMPFARFCFKHAYNCELYTVAQNNSRAALLFISCVSCGVSVHLDQSIFNIITNKKPIKSLFSAFHSTFQKPNFNFQLLDHGKSNLRIRRNVTDQDSVLSEHAYIATPTNKMADG